MASKGYFQGQKKEAVLWSNLFPKILLPGSLFKILNSFAQVINLLILEFIL